MKTAIVVLSILGLCLSAPVEPDMGRDNEPVIDEGQTFSGSPLDQTDTITRNIFYPVPKADSLLGNPFMNPFGYYPSPYYPQYSGYLGYSGYPGYPGYSGYPYYPSYSLPPVIISLPQRNP